MVSTVGGNGGLSRPLAATASAAGGRGRDGGALAGKGPKPCAATTTSTYTISLLLHAAAWQPPRSHPQATSYRTVRSSPLPLALLTLIGNESLSSLELHPILGDKLLEIRVG